MVASDIVLTALVSSMKPITGVSAPPLTPCTGKPTVGAMTSWVACGNTT
jgi:hypothetical protein